MSNAGAVLFLIGYAVLLAVTIWASSSIALRWRERQREQRHQQWVAAIRTTYIPSVGVSETRKTP